MCIFFVSDFQMLKKIAASYHHAQNNHTQGMEETHIRVYVTIRQTALRKEQKT